MKANAVVFTAPNEVAYQAITCPEPDANDAVVRVTHSWISNGTEGSFLRGERIQGDTAYHAGDPWPFPIVAGYQKIGVVESVGANVTDLEVGETVFTATGKVDGMYRAMGGQVSPCISPRNQIIKLPTHHDPLAYAGLVLTQVGYNCGVRPPVEIGAGAVVIGDGMVGQWAAQTLAWRGANVVLVGRHDDRLAKFLRGPHRHCINARNTDWVKAVQQMLPDGIQVAVDTVGSIDAVEALVGMMNRYGHIVSAGFYGTDDLIGLQQFRDSELSLDFVSGWTRERMLQTRDLITAGYLQTLPLITHHFPAADAAKAWQLIEQKREPVLGVILDWS